MASEHIEGSLIFRAETPEEAFSLHEDLLTLDDSIEHLSISIEEDRLVASVDGWVEDFELLREAVEEVCRSYDGLTITGSIYIYHDSDTITEWTP